MGIFVLMAHGCLVLTQKFQGTYLSFCLLRTKMNFLRSFCRKLRLSYDLQLRYLTIFDFCFLIIVFKTVRVILWKSDILVSKEQEC